MSAKARDLRTIRHLLVASSAGEATPEEWRQLEVLLLRSQKYRDYATLMISQMSTLEWRATEAEPPLDICALPIDGKSSLQPSTETSENSSRWRIASFFLGGGLSAAALLALMLLLSRPGQQQTKRDANETSPAAKANLAVSKPPAPILSGGALVARLTEVSSDAVWAPGGGPEDFLLRLPSGQRLELTAGSARVEFVSGAEVILQAPCELTPMGSDSALPSRGRVTGRADNGNFHLATPTAQVVDLGTEFGVSVDETSATEVIVFKGEVSVAASDRSRRSEPTYLEDGATVRVSANGSLETGVAVKGSDYLRELPSNGAANRQSGWSQPWLSLVDIVSGGDGSGQALAGAIDPLTGQWDRKPWRNPLGPGYAGTDGRYHAARIHPMFDGAFVPKPDGVDVQITSAGHRVQLPQTLGATWGPVWARQCGNLLLPRTHGDFWGTGTLPYIIRRINAAKIGAVGLHPNVGVTFDLAGADAERRARIRSLDATLVNLDAAVEVGPQYVRSIPRRSADFWVFVDGELRYSRLDFGRNVEGEPFHVGLKPEDRFITIVTTEGENSMRSDHMMLIDPVLNLAVK